MGFLIMESKITLTDDEMIKWLCLFECLDEIRKYCEKVGIDCETIIGTKAKQMHIRNYVDERFPTMSTDLQLNRMNKFCHDFIYAN